MKKIVRMVINSILLICLSSTIAFANPVNDPDWLAEADSTESTAIRVGNLVFISGQASGDTAIVDRTGAAIEESLQKISSIATQMGGNMDSIIKLDLYLTNFDTDFALFNTIFPKYFPTHYPTRTAVGVAKLSRNHTVAINAVMMLNN